MYEYRVFKGNELVEVMESNDATHLLELANMSNKAWLGCRVEIWRDGKVLVHKGLIDFPREVEE